LVGVLLFTHFNPLLLLILILSFPRLFLFVPQEKRSRSVFTFEVTPRQRGDDGGAVFRVGGIFGFRHAPYERATVTDF